MPGFEPYHIPDVFDGIPTEVVEKYGLTVLDNRKVSGFTQLLTLKTDKQIIYIEYDLGIIYMESLHTGYFVLFETIEN